MSQVIVQGLGDLGISKAAQKFVHRKIRFLIAKEGRSPKQAVAIAFQLARKKGYKVPSR
jgi:hypothetical protein